MKQLKSFGQHFLKDKDILYKINKLFHYKDEPVIEIGPGAGALTSIILKKVKHMVVIEADPRWCNHLSQKFNPKLEVLNMDALKYDWTSIANGTIVFGNLPYQIASELMIQLACNNVSFGYCLFMMQYEVAQRAMAKPSSKHYGRLSVILQTQFDFQDCLRVSPDSFNPCETR